MTCIPGPRTARALSTALLGAVLALTAAACGGEAETESDTASSNTAAPDLGQSLDRLRLTEGASYTVEDGSGGMVTVRLTGHENGDDPAVQISVAPEEGSAAEHTLRLGDDLEIGGEPWRVSEIGMSDSSSQPSSVTLTREGRRAAGEPAGPPPVTARRWPSAARRVPPRPWDAPPGPLHPHLGLPCGRK
ncbi:DUF6406 domain-containing protein [Nocardiopsis composta]